MVYVTRNAPSATCVKSAKLASFCSGLGFVRPGIVEYILSRRCSPWKGVFIMK